MTSGLEDGQKVDRRDAEKLLEHGQCSSRTWVSFPHPPADQEAAVLITPLLKVGHPPSVTSRLRDFRAGAAP